MSSQPAITTTASGRAAHVCWSCGDRRAAQFCPSCGRVQPPISSDYFTFFGLERRLNLDADALQREMYRLSRRLHPDLYARASAQEKQWSLEQTSKLNDAYRILSDAVLRTEYLIRLEGINAGPLDKSGANREAVPSELLEEVFELKMQLEQFHGGNHDLALRRELDEAKGNLEQKLEASAAALQRCWDEWDALLLREQSGVVAPEDRRRLLDRMEAVLYRRRYVATLVQEIMAALNK